MKSLIIYSSAFAISTLALTGLSACEFRHDERPSILVIAVENLSFDSVSCESGEENPGFDVFCDEAIRFTHAFTPSTMSQSVLSSVLTGLYPTHHGVHDNGNDHLAARFRTVGEAAVERGYRTSFVSGGPPIFRKSGLAQGFELFDDNVEPAVGHYYRPVSDTAGIFLDWLGRDVGANSYLAVLFLPDLQFSNIPTYTREGEMRERSIDGQIQEVGAGLQQLVENLKKKRLWNSTNVVLLGTNGGSVPSNLRSENTQVCLFIKPAHLARDGATHWTIDRNVSLVDVGQTLFSILGERVDPIDNGTLEKTSLQSVLISPDPDWRDDRVIYTESAWPQWRQGGDVEVALRQKQFLYINDEDPQIFNSLADHMESSRLRTTDPLWTSMASQINGTLAKLQITPSRTAKESVENLELGRVLWAHADLSDNLEWQLENALRGGESPLVMGWWARWALYHEDWSLLTRLGIAAKMPFWIYVGEGKQGLPMSPLSDKQECVDIFRGQPAPAACKDEALVALVRWIQEKNEDERLARRDRFLRIFQSEVVNDRIGQLHYINNLKWDVRTDIPHAPSLAELYLSLPRNHIYAAQINSLLGNHDFTQ